VKTKKSCEIGVREIGIPRKGVGDFVRVARDPFANESWKLLLCIQPSAVVLSV
jgi:hypothetical protein